MPSPLIAVAGPPGSGKTTWILEQLSQQKESEPAYYWPLGGAGVPLDACYLSTQAPHLQILGPDDLNSIPSHLAAGQSVYLEIDATLDLTTLNFPPELPLRRIALLPENLPTPLHPDAPITQWQTWANEAMPSPLAIAPLLTPQAPPQLWTAELTGQVFDPASLDLFWGELTAGAYGKVQRAKGIFCVADGQTFFFSYVADVLSTPPPDQLASGQQPAAEPLVASNSEDQSHFTELPIPHIHQGRPTYPSGIEVIGQDLDPPDIIATLRDCLLSEELLQSHQAQLREEAALQTAAADNN